jgi:acetoin utilization protein AcuC
MLKLAMPAAPLFIGSEIYRRSSYGRRHPLAIPRVSTVIDLCRALGWLDDSNYVDSPRATPDQIARFHDPAYVAALIEAERTQAVPPEVRARHNLGTIEAPVFAEMFARPATASGGAILAAELVAGGGIVYAPAGGTHHARRDRASGFCFFNDPVLALLRLLDLGLDRLVYVDIDAHHGDGVEDAFASDARVLTISVHEAGRWPGSGLANGGEAVVNLPVPAGFNDSEMAFVMDEAVLPLAQSFRPRAVVVQGGADALADDPLSKLALSNGAHWAAVTALMPLAPRLIVTGGGGYNPWSVGRCWTGVWATLNRLEVPERLPPAAEAVLRGLTWHRAAGRNPPEHWFTTLADAPRPGPVRDEVRRAARLARPVPAA